MKRDVKAIVKEMTLEEKAGMCSGKDFWHLKGVERLGIPEVMVSDGPHGLRKQAEEADHLGLNESIKAVCFPTACATACSFDRDLLQEMGESISNVPLCAEEILNISQKTPIWLLRWQLHILRVCSLRMWELLLSTLPQTIRNTGGCPVLQKLMSVPLGKFTWALLRQPLKKQSRTQ